MRPVIRLCGGNRGQIAPLVAVILAVLVLLATTVVVLSSGQKRAGVFYSDRIRAYYAAEDGVEEVLAGIFGDRRALQAIPSGTECKLLQGPTPEGRPEVKGCRQTVSDAVKLRLESRGSHRNAVRHVLFEATLHPLDFAAGIAAGRWVIVDPEAEACYVDRYLQKPAPEIRLEWFRARARGVTEGDAVLHGGPVDGWHYVNGDLTVYGGSYEGRAIFFVAGRVYITGDYRPSGGGCVAFLTPHDVYLAPGCFAEVLVAAGGDVRLGEAAQLRGGLITGRLYTAPGARAERDDRLISRSLPVFSRGMEIDYWGEMYHVIYGKMRSGG